MTPPARAVAGLTRVLGATTRAMALDAAAGVAAGAETLSATRSGKPRGLGTVRVRGLILSDESGVALTDETRLTHAMGVAGDILASQARLRLRVDDIATVREPAPTRVLDPRRNQRLLLDEIAGHTAFFRRRLARRPALSVVGDPITIVVVRRIAGNATGCSLGMTADWVVCQAALVDDTAPRSYDPTVLAHEIGHALNLSHSRDPGNLMYGSSSPPDRLRGTALTGWQRAIMHGNRHTVPPVAAGPG